MKVNKILVAAAVALGSLATLSSCITEPLPQTSTITESQLAGSSAGVESMLKGLPSSLLIPAMGGGEHTDFGYHGILVFNDHAAKIISNTGWMAGQPEAYNRFYSGSWGWWYNSDSYTPALLWNTYYPLIKSCNDLIGSIGTEELHATSRGIAKSFRAMCYLDMARHFEALPATAPAIGESYTTQVLNVLGLTVPIVDENTSEQDATNNPRVTREELFEFIFADLADAEACLTEYKRDNTNYPNLAVVYGLYARAYSWLGGFESTNSENVPVGEDAYRLAAEYARKAIDVSGATVMSEYEWTNPTTGFNTVVSSWIWALSHSTDTVLGNLHAFPAHMAPEAVYGYGPLACPAMPITLYDHMNDTDFRKKVVLGPEARYDDLQGLSSLSEEEFAEWGFTPYTCFKFRPANGENTDYMVANAISLPLMRIEEMYFIEMESIAHYDEGTANNLLQQFMRAYRDPYYVNVEEDLVTEIIMQKKIEFWGEGIVMFDMKRLNMGVNGVDNENFSPNAYIKHDSRLPWWNMPLPLSELQVNTAITTELNNPNAGMGVMPEVIEE